MSRFAGVYISKRNKSYNNDFNNSLYRESIYYVKLYRSLWNIQRQNIHRLYWEDNYIIK